MIFLYILQFNELLPNIGGTLSLFLGIAVIMAFEIIELLWDLIVAMFKHCTGIKSKKK